MTCRKCRTSFSRQQTEACPECGAVAISSKRVLLKTSTILIASDDLEGAFRSVQDVPLPVRARLMECTRGANSGTILIADEGGREEISRVMRRVHEDEPEQAAETGSVEHFFALKFAGLLVKDWVAVVTGVAASAVAWLLWK